MSCFVFRDAFAAGLLLLLSLAAVFRVIGAKTARRRRAGGVLTGVRQSSRLGNASSRMRSAAYAGRMARWVSPGRSCKHSLPRNPLADPGILVNNGASFCHCTGRGAVSPRRWNNSFHGI